MDLHLGVVSLQWRTRRYRTSAVGGVIANEPLVPDSNDSVQIPDHATNSELLLRARVLPQFGAKKLKQITVADVRRWMAKDGLAPSTVYTYRRVLTQPARKAKPP